MGEVSFKGREEFVTKAALRKICSTRLFAEGF